jgi:hypothetical protein
LERRPAARILASLLVQYDSCARTDGDHPGPARDRNWEQDWPAAAGLPGLRTDAPRRSCRSVHRGVTTELASTEPQNGQASRVLTEHHTPCSQLGALETHTPAVIRSVLLAVQGVTDIADVAFELRREQIIPNLAASQSEAGVVRSPSDQRDEI